MVGVGCNCCYCVVWWKFDGEGVDGREWFDMLMSCSCDVGYPNYLVFVLMVLCGYF